MRAARCLGDFRPAKGASPVQVQQLDQALGHFAELCAQALGKDVRDEPGSGAAGGLGFAAKAFLGAQFQAGVEVVAELVGLAEAVDGADLVITGEGRFDAQTLRGKTPFGVARIAKNTVSRSLSSPARSARVTRSSTNTASTPHSQSPAAR